MILAVVLVPEGHRRSGVVGIDTVGNQKHCRHAIVRLNFVRHRLDAVAFLADGLANDRPQVAGVGPRSAQAGQQLRFQIVGYHRFLLTADRAAEDL